MVTRRSRMHRTPTGKSLTITPRDIEIFRCLASYRYLRSTYLHAFVGGDSETRFKERLGDLFHEGFIDRPGKQWEYADARHAPAVYEAGKRGTLALEQSKAGQAESRTFLARTAHRQFAHSLAICESIASVELAARSATGLRFIPWGEILGRAPETTRESSVPFKFPAAEGISIVPDGIFGLEYRLGDKTGYRFFALEIDRGTMPLSRTSGGQTSYLAKLSGYRSLIREGLHKARLGVSKLFVLTITSGERRLREMIAHCDHSCAQEPLFLFKAVETESALRAPLPELLLAPWERAGWPALTIS